MAFQISHRTLATWLAGAMNDPAKVQSVEGKIVPAALVAFVLVHNAPGGEQEIDKVAISGTYNDEQIQELAKRFLGKADTDAGGLNGRQQYLVYPFYEGSTEPQGRFPFHRNGHLINEAGDHSTDPPTPEGRLQQRMRIDEGLSQILLTSLANVINQQNRLIEVQGARLDRALVENITMFDKLKDMAMAQALASHQYTMAQIAAQRNAALVEGAVKLAPALINTITGTEIVPQSTADTALLEALAGAITEEDLQSLAPILSRFPPPVMGMMLKRLEALAAQKQAKKDALATTLAEHETQLANGAAKELDDTPTRTH